MLKLATDKSGESTSLNDTSILHSKNITPHRNQVDILFTNTSSSIQSSCSKGVSLPTESK